MKNIELVILDDLVINNHYMAYLKIKVLGSDRLDRLIDNTNEAEYDRITGLFDNMSERFYYFGLSVSGSVRLRKDKHTTKKQAVDLLKEDAWFSGSIYTGTTFERWMNTGFHSYIEKTDLVIEYSSLRLSSIKQSNLTKRQQLVRLLLFGLNP